MDDAESCINKRWIFPPSFLTHTRYVGDSLGGVVEISGAFGFELPVGEMQRGRQSNVVPLGEVNSGVFQHRALLFKVGGHSNLSGLSVDLVVSFLNSTARATLPPHTH